jgi:tRNA G18 (ribose-2'-O)-methylase SpoU
MIIYGINPVLEAVRMGRATEVVVQTPHGDRVREIVAAARAAACRCARTPDGFRRLVPAGVHQGVAARVQPPAATLPDLASAEHGPPLIVVLDGVRTRNVGTILRSVMRPAPPRRATDAAPRHSTAARQASAGAVHTCRLPMWTSPGRSRS